jgi:hypothetical protein
MVMRELKTRPSTSSSAYTRDKKPEGSHATPPPPVHQSKGLQLSSPPVSRRSSLKNSTYSGNSPPLGEPTILIGGGVQWLHLRMDERRPPAGINAPFLILTPFGWICVRDLTTPSEAATVCRSDKSLLPIQKLALT